VYVERRGDEWQLAHANPTESGPVVIIVTAPRVSEDAHEADTAVAALPATASGLPLFALGGALMLGLGLLMRAGSGRLPRG
jgi:hypothetical protein